MASLGWCEGDQTCNCFEWSVRGSSKVIACALVMGILCSADD